MIASPIGQQVIRLPDVDSTNNFAANLCDSGKGDHGTVILADNQSNGRGQRGTKWHTLSGQNLIMSVILNPNHLKPENHFVLNQYVSVSIVHALEELGITASVKWPNDIYLNDKKIGGLLIENQIGAGKISRSIVGLGLNINQIDFQDLPYAGSLKTETQKDWNRDDVLSVLLELWTKNYTMMLTEAGKKVLNTAYHNELWRKDETHSFIDQTGKFEGKITGVTLNGELQVLAGEELRSYHLKEVSFVH